MRARSSWTGASTTSSGTPSQRVSHLRELASLQSLTYGKALAKEKAQARADAALARLNTARLEAGDGPVEATPLATLMAMQTGGSAQNYAAGMDIGEPIALVLGMLLFASLIHPSLGAIKEGLGLEEALPRPSGLTVAAAPAGKKEAQSGLALIAGTSSRVGAKRGRKPLTTEERIMQFVSERLRAGEGETMACDITEAFTAWWHAKYPGTEPPGAKTLSKVLMTRAGINRERRGGRNRYAAILFH